MNYRSTIRTLRKGDKTADAFLLTVKQYDPNVLRRTATATLENLIISKIPTAHGNTIKEALRMAQAYIHIFSGADTANNVINRIRNAIIKRYGRDSVFFAQIKAMLFVHKEDMKKKSDAYNAKVEQKNATPDEIPLSAIMSIIENPADDLETLALKIQLATGARINEVLTFSTFTTTSGKLVRQKGISKVENGEKLTITKPLMFYNADTFNGMFEKLRRLVRATADDGDDGATISNRLNTAINTRLREITSGEISKTHTLRKIYALMSWDARPHIFKKYSQQSYYAHILGHSNLNTAKSYSTIEIIPEEEVEAEPEDEPEPETDEIPRNTKARDGKQQERLTATIRALNKLGMSTSVRDLKTYGYGARVISEWKKNNRV